jgi:CDP-diacylglycerol--glycerol-3-phosphate 3-phosphatidyltransferase
MSIAAASDVYDGKLARRWGVETASLRQWDSIADTVFFLGALLGIWFSFPSVYTAYKVSIVGIIGLEAIRYAFDWAKFRRGASYHAISAKIFGVTLLAATLATMGFGIVSPFWEVALTVGIVSELEGLGMSIVLNEWTYNVKHIGIAMKIRRKSGARGK